VGAGLTRDKATGVTFRPVGASRNVTTTDGRHRIAVLSGGEVRIALVFRVVGTRIAH
jgi:hypothetical protein